MNFLTLQSPVSNTLLPKLLVSAEWSLAWHSRLYGVTITFPHSLVAFTPFHIPWFQPVGLCSVPRHDLFSLPPWMTHPPRCPHLELPFLPAPHPVHRCPVIPSSASASSSGPYLVPTAQSRLPFPWICVFIRTSLMPTEAICLNQSPGHIYLPTGPPESRNHVLGIFVSPTVSSSVPDKWYFKDICWVEEWWCGLRFVEELTYWPFPWAELWGPFAWLATHYSHHWPSFFIYYILEAPFMKFVHG